MLLLWRHLVRFDGTSGACSSFHRNNRNCRLGWLETMLICHYSSFFLFWNCCISHDQFSWSWWSSLLAWHCYGPLSSLSKCYSNTEYCLPAGTQHRRSTTRSSTGSVIPMSVLSASGKSIRQHHNRQGSSKPPRSSPSHQSSTQESSSQ
jgi:hypothetical protein